MYFALNSSYSLQDKYASVDKDGYKHMLVCSVLVGKYTKGNSKMKAAPALPDKPEVSKILNFQANKKNSTCIIHSNYISLL